MRVAIVGSKGQVIGFEPNPARVAVREVLGLAFVPREAPREAHEPRVMRGELGLGGG